MSYTLYSGKVGWRINKPMLDVIEEARKRDLCIGEIPSTKDLPMPDESTCMRLPKDIDWSYKAKKNIKKVVDENTSSNPSVEAVESTEGVDDARTIPEGLDPDVPIL